MCVSSNKENQRLFGAPLRQRSLKSGLAAFELPCSPNRSNACSELFRDEVGEAGSWDRFVSDLVKRFRVRCVGQDAINPRFFAFLIESSQQGGFAVAPRSDQNDVRVGGVVLAGAVKKIQKRFLFFLASRQQRRHLAGSRAERVAFALLAHGLILSPARLTPRWKSPMRCAVDGHDELLRDR